MTPRTFFNELQARNYFPGLVLNDLLYAPKTGFIYVACSKNACSEIKSEIYKIENFPNERREDVSPHNRSQMKLRGPRDIGIEKFWALLMSPNVPKICFSRDPYKRIESCYRNRVCTLGLEPYDSVANGRREWITNRRKIIEHSLGRTPSYEETLEHHISFEEFLKFVCSQHDYEMDRHWLPQSNAMFVDVIDYDFIGNIENLHESLNAAARLVGAPSGYEFEPKHLNRSSEKTKVRINWTDELRRIYYTRFKEDFEFFGYEPKANNVS